MSLAKNKPFVKNIYIQGPLDIELCLNEETPIKKGKEKLFSLLIIAFLNSEVSLKK